MIKNGPIVIVEDDLDDQELLKSVFLELEIENELLFFSDGVEAFAYLKETKDYPLLILSDINMPKLNGLDLRGKIDNHEQLRMKCIPFIFLTTASDRKVVLDAYSKLVQGYFVKPHSYVGFRFLIKTIFAYWKSCNSAIC